MSLDAAIDGLRGKVSALSGLSKAYTDPPESINEFPSAIVYPASGEMTATAAGGISVHTLVVEIYHSRQVLPEAVDASKVWPDLMYAALKADQSLGGAVSHIVWPMLYRVGPLRYNEQTHFGVRFEVKVKVNEA